LSLYLKVVYTHDMFISLIFKVPENKAKYINNTDYHCDLKNNFQIQHEILRGKRLKIATFPVSNNIKALKLPDIYLKKHITVLELETFKLGY